MLIDAVMSQARCRRFLAGDGITTPEFAIGAFAGVFEGVSIDSRSARKAQPAFGNAFSVAKNLDEYQHKICALVPSLQDSPAKVTLQKYRIAIAAAFAKLAFIIRDDQSKIQAWTGHARQLLVEASDAYVAATSAAARIQKPSIGQALAFFGLKEDAVDAALSMAYGY